MSSVTNPSGQAEPLIYRHEKPLFAIALVISLVVWLAVLVGTFGVLLIWVGIAFLIYLFIQSAFISFLRGTASQITVEQFPDLHERITDCCAKLSVSPVPDAYLLNGNGAFNAFATRFLGRNFIVLLSDVVDALDSEPDAINFYIGHELGHIRRSHLLWGPLLFPASILPLLGAGYSRAREYTCDLHGVACCASPAAAQHGIAALAAGSRRWRTLDATRYAAQAESSGGFWMSFHELISSYPWLVKRMARVLERPQEAKIPRRNIFAWVLALFVPHLGYAGGAASLLVTIAVIGILAAVALPAYQDYTVRAKIAGALKEGNSAAAAVGDYYNRTRLLPPNLEAAGYAPSNPAYGAVTLDAAKGIVRIQLAFQPVAGKAILLLPSLDENKRVVWKCSGGEIEARFLPQACR